jgi:hypothetical protein
VSCFHGIDGKLDIYMLRAKLDTYTKDPAIGVTVPYAGCKARPTYIVLDTRSGVPKRWVLAHELMHAFQLAFDFHDNCTSYHDWNETTATWAEQYVYPHDNEKPYFSPWYPEVSLTKASYDGWLFPYAMAQLHGAQTIGTIYQQTEHLPVAQAIDAGVPGGLAQAWPEFALKAWNDGPVAPSFKQWDQFNQQPLEAYIHGPVPTETLDVTPDSQPELVQRGLASLTREYRHFAVAANVTQVSISQQPAPGIRVDAIEHFGDGSTQTEQIQGSRRFCSDDPAKRLSDLVLVISNSSLTGFTFADPLKLSATDGTCGPAQYRVLSASITEHTTASEPGGLCRDFGGTSGSETWTGQLTGPAPDVETNKLAPDSTSQLTGQIYAQAPATRTYQGSGCKFAGNGTLQPCSYAGSTVPFVPLTVGFSIVADPTSGDATLDWSLLPPDIGAGYAKDECNIQIWGDFPSEASNQTVPLAKLLSADPQTFTLAGSAPLQHVTPAGASLENDWNLSLTVQRR